MLWRSPKKSWCRFRLLISPTTMAKLVIGFLLGLGSVWIGLSGGPIFPRRGHQVPIAVERCTVGHPEPNEEIFTFGAAGVRPVKPYGLSHRDIEFLQAFEGPLLKECPADAESLLADLRTTLERQRSDLDALIRNRWPALEDSTRLWVFLMLRTAGSTAIFTPETPPDDITFYLANPRGNCFTQSMRLLIILEAFGIQARVIPVKTPSIPGHLVVEVFDRDAGRTAILDPTNRLALLLNEAEAPLMEFFAKLTSQERKTVFDSQLHVILAPHLFRYFDPGEWWSKHSMNMNLDEFNHFLAAERLPRWRVTLEEEFDKLLQQWSWANWFHPFTLRECHVECIRAYFDQETKELD